MFLDLRLSSIELLDIAEQNLPTGAVRWNQITTAFNIWARDNGRPERDTDSLRRKFNKLVTGPPTGGGGPSPRQQRARDIENRCLGETNSQYINDRLSDGSSDADIDEMLAEVEGISNSRTSLFNVCDIDMLTEFVFVRNCATRQTKSLEFDECYSERNFPCFI